MGLFGSSDPTVKAEKAIAKEAKAEDKQLRQAEKDLAHAEKSEAKAAKAEVKAHQAQEKAVKVEQKAAAALNKATHKHDDTVNHANAAVNDVNRTSGEHQRISQEVAQKKAALENLTQQHHAHEQTREGKLNELHQQPATAASNVTNDLRTGEHVTPNGGVNQTGAAGNGALDQTQANAAGVQAGSGAGGYGAPGAGTGGAGYGAETNAAQGAGYGQGGVTDGQRTADAVKRL
ncbi:hypothetical protein I203_106708 [Kwoniella mangroviensis CBS 8507]|uniref:uncharacterized protein n=1 Tax=Kwoniella mangroviensis CBS 8507 TaxID=1296122 RepID=UPI00080D459A|nr:uncharacterized protein I203_07796 [Kwoniella mangroviensis CBS 8507]OCF63061.1 hypothetical protein I203_07796 [Kwoniella mangroviensis CBS 8507]